MYLLDTDILIWILRENKLIIKKVLDLNRKSSLYISVISIAEIYKNIFPSELIYTEELLNRHIILDVDRNIAKMAGFYFKEYSKNLKNLSLNDCLIAATANLSDLTVVSLNKKHFPFKEIKLLDF